MKKEGNDELKKVHIKNRMCYCFDEIIKSGDFDCDNRSINKKSYKNILLYDISFKTLFETKRFDEPLFRIMRFFSFLNYIFDIFTNLYGYTFQHNLFSDYT